MANTIVDVERIWDQIPPATSAKLHDLGSVEALVGRKVARSAGELHPLLLCH